jgi:hypothetical protein
VLESSIIPRCGQVDAMEGFSDFSMVLSIRIDEDFLKYSVKLSPPADIFGSIRPLLPDDDLNGLEQNIDIQPS